MRVRFSVSRYGAPRDIGKPLLLERFRLKPQEVLLFEPVFVDLVKNLRQDARLLPGKISNLDHEPATFEAKCLKNRGRVGRQPTMMPIAISANLDFGQ